MAKLSEVLSGSLIILEEAPSDTSVYKVLMAYGIFRGTQVKILRNDRWQDMILVQVKDKRVAIRKEDVKSVEVTLLSEVQ